MNENYKPKVILVGDSYSGKTCIVNRICKDIYEKTELTMFQKISTTTLTTNSQSVTVQLNDIAGNEQYSNIAAPYFRNAKVALLVFSIDDRVSFEGIDKWLNKINEKLNTKDEDDSNYVYLILVGAKVDKADEIDGRKISVAEGKEKAKEIGPSVKYIEVSSLSNAGIPKLKDKIAQLAILSLKNIVSTHEPIPNPQPKPKCC